MASDPKIEERAEDICDERSGCWHMCRKRRFRRPCRECMGKAIVENGIANLHKDLQRIPRGSDHADA